MLGHGTKPEGIGGPKIEFKETVKLGNAFFAVGNSRLAGFTDLYFFAVGFKFIKDLYTFPLTNRTNSSAAGSLII